MNYSLSVQLSPRVAHVWFTGTLSAEALKGACTELISAPEWEPGTPMIWDFSRIQGLDVTPDTWKSLLESSEHAKDRIGPSKSAAVVEDDTLHELLELYASAFATPDREFFKSDSRWDAIQWLCESDASVSVD